MKTTTILGKEYTIIEDESKEDSIDVEGNQIIIRNNSETLLKEYQIQLLYEKLSQIYDKIKSQSEIDIIGNLDFEVVDKVDNKKRRIAQLKRNKIQVKQTAVILPEEALRYIIAHELAHTFKKRHSKNFWKIVEKIYPDYRKGEVLIQEYEKSLF